MDDRGVNIDIVFRNGLKDYEVLPPQEVWSNIHPVIRKKQRPIVVLRAAATLAVVVSLGIVAYKYSMEISANLENPVFALNPESVAPSQLLASVNPADNEIAQNRQLYSKASIQGYQVVTPVTTENIVTTVKDFVSDPGSGNLADSPARPAGLLALNYGKTGYINIKEDNALDAPDNTSRKEPNKWSISALLSPTYQSRFSSGENEAVSQAMSSEQMAVSYSGGVTLSYKISKRFSVQSGFYYSSIGKELSGISAYSGFERFFYTKGNPNFEVLTSNGTVLTDNNDIFLTDGLSAGRIQTDYNINVFDAEKAGLTYLDNSIRQSFNYLELPVILRYKIVDKVLDFNIIGGVSSNLLVNNSVYASKGGSRTDIGTTDGLNLITFSSSLGMGMEYNFSNNFSLNLEPTFRYYINSFNDIPGMKIHPYSFGIFSGISYKF
ncbi:MAG: outer membrane beta-barrel protein [Bacteroidota bacterium]